MLGLSLFFLFFFFVYEATISTLFFAANVFSSYYKVTMSESDWFSAGEQMRCVKTGRVNRSVLCSLLPGRNNDPNGFACLTRFAQELAKSCCFSSALISMWDKVTRPEPTRSCVSVGFLVSLNGCHCLSHWPLSALPLICSII